MSDSKILVIVVTFNSAGWIRKCLDSVRCSEEKLDCIIIDNNSSDETVSIVESEYSEFILVPSKDNLGFGKGNNIGLEYAKNNGYEGVLLLNQDAWLKTNTASVLREFCAQNRNIGIVSPIHLSEENDALDPKFAKAFVVNNKTVLDHAVRQKSIHDVYTVNFVNAACWYLPVSVLRRVGGFNTNFFMYGEDDDYCNRILLHGLEIKILTGCFVHHGRYNLHLRERKWGQKVSFHSIECYRKLYSKYVSYKAKRTTFKVATVRYLELVINAIFTLQLSRILGTLIGGCSFLFKTGKIKSEFRRVLNKESMF